MRISDWISVAAVAAFIGFSCGCSNDTGANSRPTVSVKPKSSEEGGASETAAAGASNAGAQGASAASSGEPGTLKGVITFKGEPAEKLLVRKGDPNAKDAAVCAAENVPDESLVVGSNGGLANVFVYLQKAPSGAKVEPAPSEPVTFDQKVCTFLPHAMLVRTGQTINVLNGDNVLHNTHSNPLNGDTETFNKGVAPNDRTGIPMVYAGAERVPVSVVCDIHNWMRAWHLPLDHNFAAISGEDGSFEIANLPPGEHEFVIWHEGDYLERKYKVTIKSGETTEVDLSYGAQDLARRHGAFNSINISALTR
jgi:hypothetical protein